MGHRAREPDHLRQRLPPDLVELRVGRAEQFRELHPQPRVVALPGEAKDLVVGVLEQMLDVVALEKRGVRQHHRRSRVRLERPALDRVVLQRRLRQLATRQRLEEGRPEIAVLGAVGILDQPLRQFPRGRTRARLEFGDGPHGLHSYFTRSATFSSSSYSTFTCGFCDRICVPSALSSAIIFACSGGGSFRSWPPFAVQPPFARSTITDAKPNASLSTCVAASRIAVCTSTGCT